MLFGAAYYPEHRNPDKWDYDLDTMREANINTLRVGEFAWTRFEPKDGQYDFAWMDTFLEQAGKRGIRLLLCPPVRTLPAWLFAKDPTLRIELDNGTLLEYGSRYSFCINHPLLRKKGAALAEALVRHYGNHDGVAGWHLDNEHGDEPDCHCPICRAKFQEWCRARYETIEQLNDCWGLEFWSLQYSDFAQIPTPRLSKTHHSPGHLLAWRRFRSDCTVELVRLQSESVRKHARSGQFVTSNNQPLWNNRTDYYDMARHLDVAGTNYYPLYGSQSRGIAMGLACARGYKGGNFQVHELRNSGHMIPGLWHGTPAPGEVERLTLHCFANGAEGVFYFRWRSCPFGCEQSHGTITDFDGRPRRIYPEVRRIGRQLERLGPLIDATQVRSDVAILYDFPTRWVMETGVHWNGPANLYIEHATQLYRIVRELGYNCDVISRDSDFTRYKAILVPTLATCEDTLADRIASYAEQGGFLFWHPLGAIKDDEARIHPNRIHPRLAALLGVSVQEYLPVGTGAAAGFQWNGKSFAGQLFCDLPIAADATVQGVFTDGWWKNTPALTERVAGKGRVTYLMTFGENDFYQAYLPDWLARSGAGLCLGTTPPPEVEVCSRTGKDGARLVFLLNHSDTRQHVSVSGSVEDIYHMETVSESVELEPYGVRILHYPAD